MNKFKKFLKKVLVKTLICVIIFLSFAIIININPEFKSFVKENIIDETVSFNKVNSFFKDIFGFNKEKNKETLVSNNIEYLSKNAYKDGSLLKVNNNTPVKSINNGVVVFIGDKDDYKDLVIIQGLDGVDIWYGNIGNSNFKLYDYVSKGNIIGEVIEDELIIVMKKEKDFVAFDNYINES